MAAPQDAPEPLQYQTWALRVSLHCEGCKKEVKRVLHHIEGVYKVSFDGQQHKVVVIGNVQADTLIKKLNRFGKHAELWPEPKPAENSATGDGSGGGGGGKKKGKGKNKNKNKNKSDGRKGDEPPEKAENGPSDDGPAEAPDKPPDAEAAAAPEKQSGAEKPAANAAGSGGKRKGKKGHKDPNNKSVRFDVGVGRGGGNPGAAAGEVPPQEASKKAAAGVAGGGPPSLPPAAVGFPAQLPTYVVSYSSVQPSMSHGGAYHQHHPMATQHSSYVYSTASPGSYYIFSEENANACSVM